MKLIFHLIDGNTMEFAGLIRTKIEDGFYSILIEEEETRIRINTQFILYVEIIRQ